MAKYILLTKLSPDSLCDLARIEENSRNWKKAVADKCPEVKFQRTFLGYGRVPISSASTMRPTRRWRRRSR